METPQIQGLSSSEQFSPYYTLLQIFSYGTYASYINTPNLPDLTEAQTLKLRQLSLLTLAEGRSLSYDSLIQPLGLQGPRELEDLVISCVYANLIRATLDPKDRAVHINSVAALRDVTPGAVPDLLASLQSWAARCDATLADLDAQILAIRDGAARRTAASEQWDARIARLVDAEAKNATASSQRAAAAAADAEQVYPLGQGPASAVGNFIRTHRFGKRGSGHMETGGDGAGGSAGIYDDEAMDLDDEDEVQDGKKRSSRRKL